MTPKKSRASKNGASSRFHSMIIEMRNDLSKGIISKNNPHATHYLRLSRIGNYPFSGYAHLVFAEETPTYNACVETFNTIKRRKASIEMSRCISNQTKSADITDVPTQLDLPPADDYQLTEERAIDFLKSHGYIITKQF